jgi:hypothetical protein
MEQMNPIDQVIKEHDDELTLIRSRREKLINTLLPVVEKIDFTSINTMRASDRESLLGVISTADSLLKSAESAIQNKAKLALSKKQEERESDHSAAVLALLQQIKPGMIPEAPPVERNMSRIDDELDKVFTDGNGKEITEDELERTPMQIA